MYRLPGRGLGSALEQVVLASTTLRCVDLRGECGGGIQQGARHREAASAMTRGRRGCRERPSGLPRHQVGLVTLW